MEPAEATTDKQMLLRYAGICRLCGAELPARQDAIYERASKSVRCVECPTAVVASESGPQPLPRAEPSAPKSGVAGASAQREFERRKVKREERIRAQHPRIGGLILALSDDPQSTTAWASGARGEVALGERLDKQASKTIAVLHDRRIPGTKANIDHIVVSAGGMFVVDAKRYVDSRPELRVEGGILRPRVEKHRTRNGLPCSPNVPEIGKKPSKGPLMRRFAARSTDRTSAVRRHIRACSTASVQVRSRGGSPECGFV